MKQSSARRVAVAMFLIGFAVHVLFLVPFVSGILTDVPPQPYRGWELLNQGVNYFFIAVWVVSVPLILTLICEWIYKNLGMGAR